MPASDIDEILGAITQYESFMVVGHVGPDGDAIGSVLAMRLALDAMGKTATAVSTDGMPASCRFLPGWQSILSAPPRQPQCVIVMDCNGERNRTAAPYKYVENAKYRVLIDHHSTTAPIFDANWIDASQPATAHMLYQLLQRMPVQITADMAQCMMCGISTDTGNFRFPNTTPEVLAASGDLVRLGANISQVAFKLFEERSFEATKLLGLALRNMRTEAGGALTWAALTTEDFDAARSGDEGSENVVNFLRNVRGTRMAVLLRERIDETGPVARVSVRTDAALRADLFSAQFGGGGHAAAAGFRLRHQPFDDSVREIIKAAESWLEKDDIPGI